MRIFGDNKKFRLIIQALCLVVLGGCGGGGEGNMIALITDFGSQDPYAAQMKGAMYAVNPRANIVDLNHDLPAFDLWQASYYINKVARYYPAGTIFLVVVDPGVGSERKPMLCKTKEGKIFVGPDNGIFGHVMEREGVEAAYVLDNSKYFRDPAVSDTFHGRDIFGPVVAHVSLGVKLENFGPPLKSPVRLPIEAASRMAKKITGKVVYVDHYGNVITNISAGNFDQEVNGRLVKLTLGGKTISVPVVKNYAAGPTDRVFALFNSDGELELAVNRKSAADALKVKTGAAVVLMY